MSPQEPPEPPAPRLGQLPDAEFLTRLRERDPAAWQELRAFLRRLAASKAWGTVDESHAVEDFVQLGCLRLWRVLQRPGLDVGQVSLKAYLAVVMQNLVHEVHRRRAGVTQVPRGAAEEDAPAAGPKHRVELDEASQVFDPEGRPGGGATASELEARAAEAFAVLERLAAGQGSKHVCAIAARLLELVQGRDAQGLFMTLDTNLFTLLHGDTSRWSENKRTKHRVRLNRFREAFVRALAKHRRKSASQGGTP